ncbi:MAG: TIGR02281 family clan AA aspartic protease [Nitrospina sp.]|nr:MAG: TIGR02281 family clan AA aspartic protease [Nitrospina sp.]
MPNPYSLNKSISLLVAVCCWVVVLQTALVQAKIYKWKDEHGKVHFTDSLSKIPSQYRQGRGFETLKEAPASSEFGVNLRLPVKISREHVIPLTRLGNNFLAKVLLNGKVETNLLVDTGASSITLSEEIAQKLGIRNLKRLPQLTFSTAGGEQKAPLVVLKKVQVGGATIRNVEANINPHAGGEGYDGLLGMTFLGNYKLEIRLDTNEMVLTPLHQPGELLWGGQSGPWWKAKFTKYTRKIFQYDILAARAQGDTTKVSNLKKLLRYYKGLHKSLDKRANQVRVPKEYRVYP